MKRSKATRTQVRAHNRRLVLNAVYNQIADNRAAIATESGLTKPTVSDLIAELIEDGFLIEDGVGQSTSTGGKPPRILRFVPDARQVIGVATDGKRVYGMLTDMRGRSIVAHQRRIAGDVLDAIDDTINGLVAQLDAPLLCIGVAVPGQIDHQRGVVVRSDELNISNLALAERLQASYDCAVYISNNTELAAIGHHAFSNNEDQRNLVMVRVGREVEIAVAIRGRYHHGGAVGQIPVSGHSIDSVLAWSQICQRADELRQYYPDTVLPACEHLTVLHIMDAYRREDMAAMILYNRMADTLAYLFAWVIGIMQPDDVVLAGDIAHMGAAFLGDVRGRLAQLMPDVDMSGVHLTFTETGRLSTRGAVAHGIQQELGVTL